MPAASSWKSRDRDVSPTAAEVEVSVDDQECNRRERFIQVGGTNFRTREFARDARFDALPGRNPAPDFVDITPEENRLRIELLQAMEDPRVQKWLETEYFAQIVADWRGAQ